MALVDRAGIAKTAKGDNLAKTAKTAKTAKKATTESTFSGTHSANSGNRARNARLNTKESSAFLAIFARLPSFVVFAILAG